MNNKTTKIVERKLVKGEFFRVAGPKGVSPEVWTWDGKYENPKTEHGYICRRMSDGFTMPLYPSNYIIPLDPIEDL